MKGAATANVSVAATVEKLCGRDSVPASTAGTTESALAKDVGSAIHVGVVLTRPLRSCSGKLDAELENAPVRDRCGHTLVLRVILDAWRQESATIVCRVHRILHSDGSRREYDNWSPHAQGRVVIVAPFHCLRDLPSLRLPRCRKRRGRGHGRVGLQAPTANSADAKLHVCGGKRRTCGLYERQHHELILLPLLLQAARTTQRVLRMCPLDATAAKTNPVSTSS